MNKFCSNNLLGRDLIEKLNLFPGINNLKTKSFEDIVKNYKIDNSKLIQNFVAELYQKPEHSPSFQKNRTVPFGYSPWAARA